MRNIIIFLFLLITPLKAENVFPIDPAINYGKLENGLTYYIRENSSPKDKVVMRLFIKTGSVMEEEHQKGLAHLIEHMAFNGSKNFLCESIYNHVPKVGDIIFFPNYLMHTAYPFHVDGERRSFSLNIQLDQKITNIFHD